MARGIIGVLEGDSGVELVRTCKMAVGTNCKMEVGRNFHPGRKFDDTIFLSDFLYISILGEERGCRESFPEVGRPRDKRPGNRNGMFWG